MTALTHGELFAGISGFGIGFSRSGIETLWQVETDARCNEVLAHHWPDVQRFGDIENVGKHNLEPVDEKKPEEKEVVLAVASKQVMCLGIYDDGVWRREDG